MSGTMTGQAPRVVAIALLVLCTSVFPMQGSCGAPQPLWLRGANAERTGAGGFHQDTVATMVSSAVVAMMEGAGAAPDYAAGKFAVDVNALGDYLKSQQGTIEKHFNGRALADKDYPVMGFTMQLRGAVVTSFKQEDLYLRMEGEEVRFGIRFSMVVNAHSNLCSLVGDTCTTVMECTGASTFEMGSLLDGLVDVGTTTVNGTVRVPHLLFKELDIKPEVVSMHGLGGQCHVFEEYLTTDKVDELLTAYIPAATASINTAIAAKLATATTTVAVNSLVDIDWAILDLDAVNGSVHIGSRATVLRKDGTVVRPVANDIAYLPSPSTDLPMTLALHEAVPMAVVTVYYEHGLFHAVLKEVEVLKNRFDIVASAAEEPRISVQRDKVTFGTKASVGMNVNGKDRVDLVMTCSTNLKITLEQTADHHPAVVMQLEKVDVSAVDFDFNILGEHTLPLSLIRLAVQAMIKLLLPKFNAHLKAIPVRMPDVAGLTLAQGRIESGPGFVAAYGGLGPAGPTN